jgi:TetR/AcrR family transcriptional regulator, mexJK operon transcriptional repressor
VTAHSHVGSAAGNAAPKRDRQSAEQRRAAILDAASEVFLEHGYADASIDAVVERAGGSKATVYALFGNKEGLFSAVVARCGDQFTTAIGTVPVCNSPADSLRRIARAYLTVALSAKSLAMLRMVAGDSGRRPEVGDIFYRLGPRASLAVVAKFFRECAARGLIETADPEALADHFLAALRGTVFMRALLNPTRVPTEVEIDRHIDSVVEVFLRSARPAG